MKLVGKNNTQSLPEKRWISEKLVKGLLMPESGFDNKLKEVGEYLDGLLANIHSERVDTKYTSNFRTMCEVLREVNDIAIDRNIPELTKLAHEGLVMAKKMTAKLIEYNPRFQNHAELDKALDVQDNPYSQASARKRVKREE